MESKVRLLKPHLMGLLIFPLNKDIRNEKKYIYISIQSSERYLITERGTPQRIKTSEERDYVSGIQFAFFASSFSNTSDAPQKKWWLNNQVGPTSFSLRKDNVFDWSLNPT